MIGHALSHSQASLHPPSFVGSLALSQRRSLKRWAPAALAMSANKSSSSTHPTTFNPLPILNNNVVVPSIPAMSYSTSATTEECTLPSDTEDNFSRYSKFFVKSNGVDGMSGGDKSATDKEDERESIYWLDTLDGNQCMEGYYSQHQHQFYESESSSSINPNAPRPFSVLSWNILAQTLYEAQYQRRRITQVALSSNQQQLANSLSNSPHPHPWPKRLKRIIEILSHSNSDIICLQECELHSFKDDIAPALSKLGYDGISQEDDRENMPAQLKEATKHRDARNHICATFWKRDKFEPAGEASVRTRTLTTVLRLKEDQADDDDDDDDDERGNRNRKLPDDRDGNDGKAATPTVAVVNVHLEGHPRRFSERTHQLQHAMTDLSKRIEHEKQQPSQAQNDNIGKLNALVLAGDFNCELQSSACSTYLRMGRLGRQAGLGGIHGEDSLVLPPTLLETTEATEVIHPIMEWGRALPEDQLADVNPHPFRRNGMTSAYPAELGKDDARSHFTFCSELSKRPVPGLDQVWFSSMTLERIGLRRMFVDDAGIWERYFYDDVEVGRRMDEERRKVLAGGLPSLECDYPSDHLPIGAMFDWKWDDCGDSCCLLDDGSDECEETEGLRDAVGSQHCEDGGEVRGLNVVDSEGNDMQDDASQDQLMKENEPKVFDTPHEELDYLLHSCPYDSEEQRSAVEFVLSPLNPPLALTSKDRPTPDQMEQLAARRDRKAELLKTASLGGRPWLKKIWKASKQVGKWDRQRAIAEDKRNEALTTVER